MKDSVPFLHDHLKDRPEEKFGSKVTLQRGGNRARYLLLSVISPK